MLAPVFLLLMGFQSKRFSEKNPVQLTILMISQTLFIDKVWRLWKIQTVRLHQAEGEEQHFHLQHSPLLFRGVHVWWESMRKISCKCNFDCVYSYCLLIYIPIILLLHLLIFKYNLKEDFVLTLKLITICLKCQHVYSVYS